MTAPTKWAGSKLLLRRLRDVMAGPGSAQDRLDKIATLIARDMVAEVCSIYVRRAGDVLELFATEGLKPESVHHTRLRIGEGIVGEIAAYARPTALSDAQSHPNFAYRPETGEEAYTSLMGVPILRGGRTLGVLAVQNVTPRHYTDDEVETMETVAMVVAELISSGELVRRKEQAPADGIGLKPLRLEGVKLNGGPALGRAFIHRPIVPIGNMVAEDAETERQRLEEALGTMHSRIDDMVETADAAGDGDHVDILKTYRMIAEDRGWIRRITEAIETGLTAEAGVVKVQNETRARMGAISDPYLRERLLDLEDLAYRLLQHLAGDSGNGAERDLPDETIIVARAMGPAELLDYDRNKVKALILEEGSATSHVAIVARALDIPVLGRVKDILRRVEPFDRVAVDGDNAVCYIRPGEEFRAAFETSLELFEERRASYKRDRELPAVTRDGTEVSLQMNAGLLIDMTHLHETGAEGIGLYRTEVPFMVRNDFPDSHSQSEVYTRVFEQAVGKPITFRTLDIGGDKVLPYFQEEEEENPAMGWRAVRIALDRPGIMREQLRAMIRSADGRDLRVMFPMVAEVSEFRACKRLLMREIERASANGTPLPQTLSVGVMLEVPSLVFQLETLAQDADFVSVGSNDLMQFVFASDRGNPRLDGRYDPLSPPSLSMLHHITRSCRENGLSLSICGEMAGDPLQAMTLIGLGVTTLSMAPGNIGPVRRMVRSLNLETLRPFIDELRCSPEHSCRARLAAFARDHGVSI